MTGAVSMGWRVLVVLAMWGALAVAVAGTPQRPVLIVGDSLSAAYNMPEADGWVSLLEDRLDEASTTPPKVINASISGETTAGGLSRLPALLEAHAPGVVVIELGGNDGLRGLAPGQIRDNLDRMIALGGEAGAKVVLVGIDIPPNYGAAYRERLRGVYRELAEVHEVPLLPFFLEGVALEPGLMQPDGVHPTAAAQPLLLDNIWPLLAEVLELDEAFETTGM